IFNMPPKILESKAEVIEELCSLIKDLAACAIKERGSVAKLLCEGLPVIETDWSKWKLFFCDERLVPEDDPDSTFRLYSEGLLSGSTPLTKDQFVTVDTNLGVDTAASDYESKIREFFPGSEWPTFDLLLLGVGPDGHVASLFPGHPLLNECQLWVAPISDSPKPPPCRVTMTLPAINHARRCVIAVTGEEKALTVKKKLVDEDDVPCTRVNLNLAKLHGSWYWSCQKLRIEVNK
ncbi:6-phosphogluconolactonase, partial [Armadillidium vulgare]